MKTNKYYIDWHGLLKLNDSLDRPYDVVDIDTDELLSMIYKLQKEVEELKEKVKDNG